MIKLLVQLIHDLVHLHAPGCSGIKPQYSPTQITTFPADAETALIDVGSLPTISVVIPSYNQARFLEETILSVLEQSYPRLELIVADGGSTDHSAQVIEKFSKRLKWWVSEPDSGQAEAINKGMRQATGNIMAWLNSDDMLMPGSLFKVAKCFMDSPHTDVVYGHRILIDEAGMDVGKWILPAHDNFILSYADYIPQETMFWRKDIWEKAGGRVDEAYQFALDWDLINRFLYAGAKFYRIPAFLGQFRLHQEQKTNTRIEDTGLLEMERIRAQYLEKFPNKCVRNSVEHLRLLNLAFYMFKAKLTELAWRWGLTKIQ